MSNATVSNAKTIHGTLLAQTENLRRLMPIGMSTERFVQIAWGAIRNNPRLLECTAESIVTAVQRAASLGLSFDPALGQAHMVPYFNSKKKVMEAQYQTGYRGNCQLAYRSERIVKIYSLIVHKDDKFEMVDGTEQKIAHIRNLEVDRTIESDWVGVYSVAVTKEGATFCNYMTAKEVYRIRNCSKAWKDERTREWSLWITHPHWAWMKTPIPGLCKFLPQSPEMEAAIKAAIEDEYSDAGVDVPTPELTAGAIEVAPEATRAITESRNIWQSSWDAGGALCLGNVPSAITEQIKFKDLAAWMPKRKVWLATPECADDLVVLFQDCGYELKIPPAPDGGSAATPEKPGQDAPAETLKESVGF